jgi:uncharacterized membrane protein
VNFTATVTAADGSPTVTGTVVFLAGSDYLGEANVGSNGKAVLSNVKLPVGTYTIQSQFKQSNLFDASAASVSQTVVKADPVLTLNSFTVAYDTVSHGVSPRVYGADGADLGLATITYSGDGSAPTQAGTYTVTASYGGDAGYNAITKTATITITKREVSLNLLPINTTFNGQSHPVAAEVYAFDGTNLGPATITYSSGTAPIHAGEYTATATFAATNNYAAASVTTTISIAKAASTVTVASSTATYDGSSHTAACRSRSKLAAFRFRPEFTRLRACSLAIRIIWNRRPQARSRFIRPLRRSSPSR